MIEKPSIVETIAQYLKLSRSGKEYKAHCPFHEDKTPSFSVSEEKGVFLCFGCGARGDVFDFLIKWSGKNFQEILAHLGIHGNSRRVQLDDSKVAAEKIHQWAIFFSDLVAQRLREIGSCKHCALEILREGGDKELLSWFLQSCERQWIILETLHDDLANPEYILELYAERENLERLVNG